MTQRAVVEHELDVAPGAEDRQPEAVDLRLLGERSGHLPGVVELFGVPAIFFEDGSQGGGRLADLDRARQERLVRRERRRQQEKERCSSSSGDAVGCRSLRRTDHQYAG